ncbi:MAG: PAS domain S-box protein [Nitrospira sp.]|nr:PAS domain S-box protein [Nitrospira sp.]
MAKKPDGSTKDTALRLQAEERLHVTNRDVVAMPVKDVQQLVHELQVHQIELEMQNDELRRTQVALEVARDRYVALYDFSPAGHLTLDRDGTIVEASLRAGMLLGLNRNELIEQPLTRFVAAEDQDRLYRHVQEVLKTGTRQNCEMHIRKKAGAADCVYLESLAVHEEPGRITHWRTSLLDISDRKRAEQELETQRTQLEAIIGSAMDAIITVDEQEHVVLFNRAAESMFGCRAAEAIGQPLDRFIPERYREAHHGHMSRFAKSGAPSRAMQREGTLFGLRANGEEFPLEASISRVLVAGKTLFTVILRDVTERKRAEQEQHRLIEDLTQSQQHFQALFNWTPSAVGISTLPEGRFCDVNEGFSRLTGYTREEVIGRTTLELGLWANPSKRASVLQEIQERGRLHNREGLLRTKSGEIRTIMVSVEPIQLGSIPCLIYLGHDITDRKRTEDELVERARLSGFVAEASLALNRDKPLNVLLQQLTDTIVTRLGYAFARIWTMGPGDLCEHCHKVEWCQDRTECLHLTASAGLSVNRNGEFRRVPLGALKIGQIAQGAGAIISNDILQDDRLPNKQWMRENGLQSFAGYPLVVEGRVFGVLALFGTHASSPLTLQALESVCHGLATAIARKRAENSLRDQEREFHLLADNVPAFYAYIDTELRYGFMNKRHEEFFGRPVSDMVGKLVKDVVGEINFDEFEPYLREALAGQAVSFMYPMVLPNGNARWMSTQYMPDGDDAGLVRGILALSTDVTAQKQAELALQQSQSVLRENREELQALTEKLLTAQEQERKRIARDLHDDFNQRLAALAVELETIERSSIVHLPEPILRQLARIHAGIGRLSDDLHDLAYNLHPSLLDHVGLEVAMRDHIAEFTKRTGVPVTFTAREAPKALSPDVKTNLFRVMQESLQNVFKHAQANHVTVRLSGSSKGVGVSVRDNGKGFDLEGKDARKKGLGLVSMQERARLLGGFLRVHSLPADGTKVCVWVPRSQEGA